MIWSVADREKRSFQFLGSLIERLKEDPGERIEAPLVITQELFLKDWQLLELCKELRVILGTVLYVSLNLADYECLPEELKEIKKGFGGYNYRPRNVEDMEDLDLFRIAAKKDLERHNSLAYFVARLEYFCETHPHATPHISEEVENFIRDLELPRSAREMADLNKEGLIAEAKNRKAP